MNEKYCGKKLCLLPRPDDSNFWYILEPKEMQGLYFLCYTWQPYRLPYIAQKIKKPYVSQEWGSLFFVIYMATLWVAIYITKNKNPPWG